MRKKATFISLIPVVFLGVVGALAEDGYELWLRYRPVADPTLLQHYRESITTLVFEGDSPTLRAARQEISRGLRGLLGAARRPGETSLRRVHPTGRRV